MTGASWIYDGAKNASHKMSDSLKSKGEVLFTDGTTSHFRSWFQPRVLVRGRFQSSIPTEDKIGFLKREKRGNASV